MNYIGLDAHSATCTFVNLDKEGKLLSRCRVDTTEKNLLQFVRSQTGPRKLVFEELNLSQWLYVLFKNEVEELVVCNPTYIGKRPGSKDDYKDALHLANELRCNHIVPVFHEQSPMMDLRVLMSGYSDVVKEITQTKNRYKAIFRSQGLKTKGTKIYVEQERIKELSLGQADRFVAEDLFERIRTLEESKEKYFARFKANTKKHSILRKLETVPGISFVRSHTIASLICSPHRFKNKHKLWGYSMLAKHDQMSDGRSYGKKVVRGRRELKSVFDGTAITVLRGNSSLRKHYDQLRTTGLGDQAARKSVARKIAAICLAIFKHDKKYDDKYEEKQRRLLKKKV